jgi:hypothetical protein
MTIEELDAIDHDVDEMLIEHRLEWIRDEGRRVHGRPMAAEA